MFAEKGLFLVLLFLIIVIIKYLCLKKEIFEQRNYFLQTLSHDLRVSAIAQIRGLDFIYKDESLQGFHKQMLSCVSDSCKFSLDMINMLLNTYKFDRKEAVLNYECCNIAEVISNSCNINLEQSEDKNIKLINFADDICFEFDKNYISKVINILLSTAIFYSNKNSIIKIFSCKSCNKVEINILYSGEILTEEEQKRMFSKNSKFSTVGHGIKMHLCKKIIDFHKGKISVKKFDKSLVSFTFSLPIKSRNKKFTNCFCKLPQIQYMLSR